MASLNRMVVGGKENARAMLESAGIGEYNATLSLPYFYFMPRSCDPFTQGVMQLVEGIQNMVRARGRTEVRVTGVIDGATGKAIEVWSGPGWRDKNWMQIYGDIINGKPALTPKVTAADLDLDVLSATAPESAMSGILDPVSGLLGNPMAWFFAGGAALYYYFGIKRPNPRRRRA